MTEKIDLYSTHLFYLKLIFDIKGELNNVVEFGMGNYSTEFLLNNSKNLISIEMQYEDWYNKIFDLFNNKLNWKPNKLLGPFEFYKLDMNDIDLAFVDGHGSSRPECINHMMSKNCPIIIAHDTEEPGYGWNRVDDRNYYKVVFKKFENWTTLWTTDFELYEKIKKIE